MHVASLPLFENRLYTRTHYFLNIQPIPLQEEMMHFGKDVFLLRKTTYVLKKTYSSLSQVASFEQFLVPSIKILSTALYYLFIYF